ncbi:hypothetical protein [Frankia sp. CcWB2]
MMESSTDQSSWSDVWSHIPAANPQRSGPLWALAVLIGPDRAVEGVVGFFVTPAEANRHARAGGYENWLVIPALDLHGVGGPVTVL